MSEEQYRLEENNQTNELLLWKDDEVLNVFESSYDNRKHLNIIVDKLNEQQDTIITLKTRLEKINGGYGHLTHYKGLTANEWVIESHERELRKKDEQISEWIEQHSKDIVNIGEQNKLIQNLKEENEQLKKQMKSFETTMNATSDYNAYLQAEIKDLEKQLNHIQNLIYKEKMQRDNDE